MTIQEMEARRAELANTINSLAALGGELTEEQDQAFGAAAAEAQDLDSSIAAAKQEERQALAQRLSAQVKRQETNGYRPGPVVAKRTERPGFSNLGEFGIAAFNAAHGRVDSRLAAVYTGAGSSVDADGGYLVGDDFRPEILSPVLVGNTSYLALCDQRPTSGDKVVQPLDEDTPWGTALMPALTAEGGAYGTSKPVFGKLEIGIKKEAVAIECSDELLEDAPQFSAFLGKKLPEKFTARMNKLILTGAADGSQTVKGIFTSAAKLVIAKETGQAIGSVVLANIEKMYAAFPQASCSSPSSRWLIHPKHKLAIMALKDENNNRVWMHMPGGAAQAPFETLYGIKVEWSPYVSNVGEQADVALVDFSAYIAAVRSNGVKTDTTMHLGFLTGTQHVRASMRVGGAPALTGPVTLPDGTTQLSPFVLLGARNI